nr:UTRA domain-containing protein [Acuticoccus kandeliae]
MKPIHQQIFDDIEGKIMDGRWQPGQRIPYEYELEEEYGCSRMTVNKALTALADRGMIIRKRRAGSFVAQPQIDRTVMEIQDIGAAAQLAGHDYAYEIQSSRIERLGEADAARLGVDGKPEVRRITCLHLVDGRPHAVEDRMIMLDAVPRARFEGFDAKPPGSWLLEQVPWSAAKHVITAIPADAAIARALDMAKGAPCLLLSRQTWQGGRTVTYVEITHPGDRYQFTGYFQPLSPASH